MSIDISNYYHYYCDKQDVVKTISIKCEDCLSKNNRKTDCFFCEEISVIKKICNECESIENKIKELSTSGDEVIFKLSQTFKNETFVDLNLVIQLEYITEAIRYLRAILISKM